MRYSNKEVTTVAGMFQSGDNVTIKVIDANDDTLEPLLTDICTESEHIPGMFLWKMDNLLNPPEGSKHYIYEMTNGKKPFYGKFTYGGLFGDMKSIRDELISIQHGALEIVNNQLILKDREDEIIAVFDLYDQNGNPSMISVFKREVVQ